ncbi:MAG: triose-phosphate isomerase, partial [Candidatus Omnitrophota bacterium]
MAKLLRNLGVYLLIFCFSMQSAGLGTITPGADTRRDTLRVMMAGQEGSPVGLNMASMLQQPKEITTEKAIAQGGMVVAGYKTSSAGFDTAAFIDDIMYTSDLEQKFKLFNVIRVAAEERGIWLDSTQKLEEAIAREEVQNVTIPEMNIRMMTYDIMKTAYIKAKKMGVKAIVFEIARSEIGYTDQQPPEYSALALAAAMDAEWEGPVFMSGDHFQASKAAAKGWDEKCDDGMTKGEGEIGYLKELISKAIRGGFYNIDIDASTTVDISLPTEKAQQERNAYVTNELTKYIREIQPEGVEVSVGGEIGEVGDKNSTPEDFIGYMDALEEIMPEGVVGPVRISVQTGSSHGGSVTDDGEVIKADIDFAVLDDISPLARKKGMSGAVQHGASTLPDESFAKFPANQASGVHLATGFQNIVYEGMDPDVKGDLYYWLKDEPTQNKKILAERNNLKTGKYGGLGKFYYKSRKLVLGRAKRMINEMDPEYKNAILENVDNRMEFFFKNLNVAALTPLVDKYYAERPYAATELENPELAVKYAKASSAGMADITPWEDLPILMGAQRIMPEYGAGTGRVPLENAVKRGARFMIAGHSDNRRAEGVTDEVIRDEVRAGLGSPLIEYVILCAGENLQEREDGLSKNVVERQLRLSLQGIPIELILSGKLIIAYEPVWAIRTGKTASAEDGQVMARFIKETFATMYEIDYEEACPVLYGGSVKPNNIENIIAQDDIDGTLVGGASLTMANSVPIIQATQFEAEVQKKKFFYFGNWKGDITSSPDLITKALVYTDKNLVVAGIAPGNDSFDEFGAALQDSYEQQILGVKDIKFSEGDLLDAEIKSIRASKSYCLGTETVRVDVELTSGAKGFYIQPAGTSAGQWERHTADTVDKAIDIINNKLAGLYVGKTLYNLNELSEMGNDMYEMEQDEFMGANVTLPVQTALAWALSRHMGFGASGLNKLLLEMVPADIELNENMAKIQMNATNGGRHADNDIEMQEFMYVPCGKTTEEEMIMGHLIDTQLGLIYRALGLAADPYDNGVGKLRGKEGGYKIEDLTAEKLQEIYSSAAKLQKNPILKNLDLQAMANEEIGVHEFVICCTIAAVKNSGYIPSTSREPGTVGLSFDPASTEMLENKEVPNKYRYEGNILSSQQLSDVYGSWIKKYPIFSIEDGLSENDFDGWVDMIEK